MWEEIKGWSYILLVLGIVSTCTYGMMQSDMEAEKVCDETEYFIIHDKDYKNTSGNIITDNYEYVIMFTRYDKNKIRIKCKPSINKVSVSEHYYNLLEVGIMYPESKVNIKTYGYN